MPVSRNAWTEQELAIVRENLHSQSAAHNALRAAGKRRPRSSVERRLQIERRLKALADSRPLAADIARCIGIEKSDGTFDQQCHDCKRRTDRSTFPLQVWMAPMEDGPCEFRIGKDQA